VALPGARLPGAERPLAAAKLRGVTSSGMILSETELGLGEGAAGIMVLAEELPPGTPLVAALPIADTVLELEVTSNRADLMSVYGWAREVHAITEAPLAPLDESEPETLGAGEVSDYAAVRVEAPDLCPRYMARVLTDVRVGPSPAWLRARVEAAGMRAISNVVDITNYVMLLTGQPLHAFDLDHVAGGQIVVRRARYGEPVTTLDGQERRLTDRMLAICDAERPAVVAGIMGAADVEVSDATRTVLLEAATFDGPTIYDTSVALGLRSESSARFEKRLPPQLPARAMAIACRMLVELADARLVPGALDAAEPLEAPPRITFRHERLEALSGMDVSPQESAAALRRLGCEVEEGPRAHEVQVPFERAADLTREVDLIEEVVRVVGLDRVPELLPRLVGRGRRRPERALAERLARRAADLGLSESITYSMVAEGDADLLRMAPDDPRRQTVRIANPLTEEMGVMRRSMLPGLLRAAARNQARQRADGGLFEIGRTYGPGEGGLAEERAWLAGLVWGEFGPRGWRTVPRPVDVHAAVGLAQALARAGAVELAPAPNEAPYFHPVRQARLLAGDATVAWAGEVHPLVLRNFDLAGPAAAIVIDLAALLAAAPTEPRAYEDLVTVPTSTRDLAVVVDEAVPVADLVSAAREAGRPLVRAVEVFDRYVGAQVGEGKVSLALRLSIVDPGRTLTDEEIDAAAAAVAAALEARGARMRT
jgi:phenylalanyl-tRNA synthetase beta chain